MRTGKSKLRRGWLIALAAAVVLIGGSYGIYRFELRAPGPSGVAGTSAIPFTIKPGQTVPQIVDSLKSAGLIRDRLMFTVYISLHGLRAHLQAGTYELKLTQSADQIAGVIAGGKTTSRKIIIPEGYTIAQIKKLAVQVGIPAADFTAATSPEASYPQAFLAGRPAGIGLEGYLFPDSYELTSITTAHQLVSAMLDNFGRRVASVYQAPFAIENLTLHQGLTLASIVEREVSSAADRPIVAQIFLSRLRAGATLGSDVTVQYAADQLGVPFDINLDSPFNTRLHAGLPPGPICNPGTGALDAVANPAKTDYLYFLAGKDGKTHFAKTYAEHQRNVQLYLN